MKSKILAALLFVSLALNVGVIGTVGYHWLHHGMRPKNPAGFIHHMKKVLRLSDEQVAAMEKDRAQMETDTAAVRQQLESKRRELFTLVDSQDAYTPQIDQLIGGISTLQMEMEKNAIRHSFVTKKILTPEQRQKFTTMLHKRFGKNHMPPPPPPDGPAQDKTF